jgi:hypothetical protein
MYDLESEKGVGGRSSSFQMDMYLSKLWIHLHEYFVLRFSAVENNTVFMLFKILAINYRSNDLD